VRLRYTFLDTCFEREGLWLFLRGRGLPMVGGQMWGGDFGGCGGCRRWQNRASVKKERKKMMWTFFFLCK